MSIDPSLLRDELRHPDVAAVLREFIEVVADETEYAESLKTTTGVHISLLDLGLLTYVLNWYAMKSEGSRAQSLIDTFPAPRRTIRDGIDRLIAAGLVTREGSDLFPTAFAIDWMNSIYRPDYDKLKRLSEAFLRFHKALEEGR